MHRLYLTVALLCAAAPSAAELYECDIEERGRPFGYMPQRLLVQPLSDGSGVLVQDQITMLVQSEPVLARVKRRDDELLQLNWTVSGLKSRQNQFVPRMLYRFTLWVESGVVRVTAHPAGYEQIFFGKGSCARRE